MHKLIPLAAALAAGLPLALQPALQDPKPAAAVPIAYEGSTITSLQVSDLAKSREWYAKILGSKVFYEFEPGGWCEMTTPVERSLIGLSLCTESEKRANNGGSALSFGVRDVAKAKDWLVRNEVKLLGEIVEIPEAVKLLSFSDPDGNTLMFYEPFVKPK